MWHGHYERGRSVYVGPAVRRCNREQHRSFVWFWLFVKSPNKFYRLPTTYGTYRGGGNVLILCPSRATVWGNRYFVVTIWLLFHRSMNTFGSTVTNTCPPPQPLRGSSHDRSYLSSSYRSRIDFEALWGMWTGFVFLHISLRFPHFCSQRVEFLPVEVWKIVY
jgi:hypothetical protein